MSFSKRFLSEGHLQNCQTRPLQQSLSSKHFNSVPTCNILQWAIACELWHRKEFSLIWVLLSLAAVTPITTSSVPSHPQIIFNQTLQSGVRSFIKVQSSSASASRLLEETATTLSAPLWFLRIVLYSGFNFKNMCFMFKYWMVFAELKW